LFETQPTDALASSSVVPVPIIAANVTAVAAVPKLVPNTEIGAPPVVGPLLGEIFVRTGESYENAGAPVPPTPSNRVLNRIALPTPSGPKSHVTAVVDTHVFFLQSWFCTPLTNVPLNAAP
jgi:hypothetical protein